MLKITTRVKSMPLPVQQYPALNSWTSGTKRVDNRLPEDKAQHYRMRYPDAQWVGSGDYGIAVECEPGVICKYTSHYSEFKAASRVMELGDVQTGTCKIYDAEEINENLWLIKSEKCRTLTETEKIIYRTLDMTAGPTSNTRWLSRAGLVPSPNIAKLAKRISDGFLNMKENLLRSGLSSADAHSENVGWNSKDEMVLLDLGGSI